MSMVKRYNGPPGFDGEYVRASDYDALLAEHRKYVDEVAAHRGVELKRIRELETALRCERETGNCVMVHDPERSKCTPQNCVMTVLNPGR